MSALAHALTLAGRGYYVHPVRLDKRPYLGGWGVQATTDPQVLTEWWSTWPDALAGVVPHRTGHVVVDIDQHDGKEDGFASAALAGAPVVASVEGASLSGKGKHLWFRGTAPTTQAIMPGIDVRGTTGYVVVPYNLPDAASRDFEAVPPCYVKGSTRDAQQSAGGSAATPALGRAEVQAWADSHDGDPSDRMRAYVASTPSPFRGRDVLHKRIMHVVCLAAEGEPGGRWALAQMQAAWMDAPHNESEEDAMREFLESLTRNVTDHGDKPELPSAADITFTGDRARAVSGEALMNEKKRRIHLITIPELKKRPSPEWFVEDLLMEGSLAILAGDSAVGKSFIALDMTARIANGQNWWGRKVRQGKVLYVVGEGVVGFKNRIHAWEQHNGVEIDPEQFILADEGVNLSDEDSVAELKQIVVEHEVDFVVLDTFSQLSNVESENDASQVARVLKQANAIQRARPRTTVMIAHHISKGSGKMRGSSALRGNVDTVIMAYGNGKPTTSPNYEITITTEGDRDGKSKESEPTTMGGFGIEQVVLPDGKKSGVITRRSITFVSTDPDEQAIEQALADGQAHGVQDMLAMLGDTSEAARKRVVRKLQTRVDAGLVDRTGDGRWTTYRMSSGQSVQP